MDKEQFGAFVAELRREKGWTQKDLAEKLYVSDKAVSKWERGLSLPDVSLLMPLADLLGVTVTELLEGKRMENPEPKTAEQVEELVKRALSMTEEEIPMTKERKKRIWVFVMALVVVALEWLVMGSIRLYRVELNLLEGLSIGFGFYFWMFVREKLPDYYDSNKINGYNHGPLRMNIPGVNLNNNNWPHIVKVLRIWTMVTMLTVPLIPDPMRFGLMIWVDKVILALYLAGMVFALYRVGKKYE